MSRKHLGGGLGAREPRAALEGRAGQQTGEESRLWPKVEGDFSEHRVMQRRAGRDLRGYPTTFTFKMKLTQKGEMTFPKSHGCLVSLSFQVPQPTLFTSRFQRNPTGRHVAVRQVGPRVFPR